MSLNEIIECIINKLLYVEVELFLLMPAWHNETLSKFMVTD